MQYITARLSSHSHRTLAPGNRVTKKGFRDAIRTDAIRRMDFICADLFHGEGRRFTLGEALTVWGGPSGVTIEVRYNDDRDVAMLLVTRDSDGHSYLVSVS